MCKIVPHIENKWWGGKEGKGIYPATTPILDYFLLSKLKIESCLQCDRSITILHELYYISLVSFHVFHMVTHAFQQLIINYRHILYNHSQLPPNAAYYQYPPSHLLLLWCFNWLNMFALMIGCLLDCLMPPVGLSGQTEEGGGCVTIAVIRMQSLLMLTCHADIIMFVSLQVAGENINTEPPGEGEHATWSRQRGRLLLWSWANSNILEASRWPFIAN